MNKVTVIDSIMGAGKTTYAINKMKKEIGEGKKFIYVTPYLSEVERVKNCLKEFDVEEPSKEIEGIEAKGQHFKQLLSEAKNIVISHQLFKKIDDEVINLLNEVDYQLIIDEDIQLVDSYSIDEKDIDRLVNKTKELKIHESGLLEWIGEEDKKSEYKDIYKDVTEREIYYFNKKFFVWLYKSEVFKSFTEVTVLSYFFKGNLIKYYFDFNKIDYEIKSVIFDEEINRYKLVDYDIQLENRSAIMDLINIDKHERRNEDFKNRLGATQTRELIARKKRGNPTAKKDIKKIENHIRNFLRGYKTDEVIWTTLKEASEHIKPQGYKTRYLALNTKATNDYREVKAVAYFIDRHPPQSIKAFFQHQNIEFDSEAWAVADFLQFIFRSAIRDGKEIDLYLPAIRMRRLLKTWSNYEI